MLISKLYCFELSSALRLDLFIPFVWTLTPFRVLSSRIKTEIASRANKHGHIQRYFHTFDNRKGVFLSIFTTYWEELKAQNPLTTSQTHISHSDVFSCLVFLYCGMSFWRKIESISHAKSPQVFIPIPFTNKI